MQNDSISIINAIDSLPIETKKLVRHKRHNKIKLNSTLINSIEKIGYNAAKDFYFSGYKATCVYSEKGNLLPLSISSGNEHDLNAVKDNFGILKTIFTNGFLIGDKGYVSKEYVEKFEKENISFFPLKRGKKASKAIFFKFRKLIETSFSKLVNYFKGYLEKAKSRLSLSRIILASTLCYNLKVKN